MSTIDQYVEKLYNEAREAMKKAIAPYSQLRVGASLLTTEYSIYRGCNIENPSLMMSYCAEKVAMIKAISEGVRDIRAIMIVSSKDDYCYPCGSCRQLIYEFAPDAEIFLSCQKGIKKFHMEELLPYSFKQ